jgi:hypothetical protein
MALRTTGCPASCRVSRLASSRRLAVSAPTRASPIIVAELGPWFRARETSAVHPRAQRWSTARTPPNPESEPLAQWALRIAAGRGKRIAAVALARKLAGILHAMTKHERTFEPERLRHAVRASQAPDKHRNSFSHAHQAAVPRPRRDHPERAAYLTKRRVTPSGGRNARAKRTEPVRASDLPDDE